MSVTLAKVTLVNLTPHPICFTDDQGRYITREIAPSGMVARMNVDTADLEPVDGIPVVKSAAVNVSGLPDPINGTFYITSTPLAQAVKRADVLSPDTGHTAVRENGQIVAVRRLQSWA